MIPKCNECGQPVTWHRDAPSALLHRERRHQIAATIAIALLHSPLYVATGFIYQDEGEADATILSGVFQGKRTTITIKTEDY